MLKLLIELIGSAFLSLIFNTCGPYSTLQFPLLFGLWVLLIFGAKISGGHYNPAVSLGFIIRKDPGTFSRIVGVVYILFQVIGAFLGSMLAWFFNFSNSGGSIYIYGDSNIICAVIGEAIGTFILVFFYLVQTEKSTKYSKDPAFNCLIIASSYIAARSIVASSAYSKAGAVLNPAIGFGTCLVQLFANGWTGFQYFWIFSFIPFGGAIIAVVFYEFAFKKT